MEFIFKDIEEKDKNLATVERIWSELLDKKATRQDTLVAIGGGATLDTVGFAAATYKRGMKWIAVPTTLLSMVDAGTGGKTAVNFGGIKNAVGAFHLPTEVRIDPSYLKTLPYEELLSGYGEMIKHALLDSKDHFHAVLSVLGDIPSKELIERSRSVKLRIVDQDPNEQGLRKALNLGHTIGHALEALSQQSYSSTPVDGVSSKDNSIEDTSRGILSNEDTSRDILSHEGTSRGILSNEDNSRDILSYEKVVLRHGYAVLYGLVTELYLSHIILGLDKEVVSAISHLIPEFYPRPNISCRQYDQLIELMQQDKKQLLNSNEGGSINFTLLRHIGEPCINQTATREQIFEALDYLFSL